MEIILKILKIQVTFKYKNKFSKHQVLSFCGQSFLKCTCEPPDLQKIFISGYTGKTHAQKAYIIICEILYPSKNEDFDSFSLIKTLCYRHT